MEFWLGGKILIAGAPEYDDKARQSTMGRSSQKPARCKDFVDNVECDMNRYFFFTKL